MIRFCEYRKKRLFLYIVILCVSFAFFISKEKDEGKHMYVSFGIKLLNHIKGPILNEKVRNVQEDIYITCSEEVAELGFHQKVISYSFLNKNRKYWIGINHVMHNISTLYPGWRVRIYASSRDILFLRSIVKNWTFLNFCDIDNLPAPIYTVSPYPVTMWRFTPLGDDQVDILLSRDIDSEILKREYDAVSVWLNSTNKSLHIMRDHPHHGSQILGGTWGLRIKKPWKRRRVKILKHQMFKKAFNKTNTTIDQTYLNEILWPEFKNDFLAHDSYLCERYLGSSPFPTRRENDSFVGDVVFEPRSFLLKLEKCPSICRPQNHLDWEYC
ncbi:UNVERIFIED_CONTAM: hypothetical protein RMT77_012266 [Armadillidium vulgare]